ncbi:hypothetical protein BP6252_09581 [Coleophoma cylindrospora]|uniref:Oxidase ustYa n=1 Tax=Coleophoma cylindrospora TaxID=1849047 RepID=A0A3D8R2A6_9HELO|nr:hypothetical protein BP6252_09581 [Coleophoma cylindrospora]
MSKVEFQGWSLPYQCFWQRFRFIDNNAGLRYQQIRLPDDALRQKISRWKQRFYILSGLYIITVLLGVATFMQRSSHARLLDRPLRTDAIFGDIPRTPIPFTPNQTYIDVFPGTKVAGSENMTLWDELQPHQTIGGGGFIAIQTPDRYGLVGGLPLASDKGAEDLVREGYGISLFHQVHCLVVIRSAFQAGNKDDDHVKHCFEYIRQAIMCTGDTTLEKVTVDDQGVLQPEIDGWGVVHQCRSYSMLFDIAEKHRVKVIGDS